MGDGIMRYLKCITVWLFAPRPITKRAALVISVLSAIAYLGGGVFVFLIPAIRSGESKGGLIAFSIIAVPATIVGAFITYKIALKMKPPD